MRVSTSFQLGLPGRWLVSAVALLFVARTLHESGALRGPWPPVDGPWLLGAVLLLPLNLGLEVAKWMRLTGFRLGPAVRHVFVGAAAGFLTPNRIGDGFGRAAAVHPDDRERALRAWTTSAGAQTLVTVAAGAGALIAAERTGWALLATLATLAGTRLFLSWSPLITPWAAAAPVPTPLRAEALLWSSARYAVFTAQFLLALLAYGVVPPAAWPALVPEVATVWLCNALVPTAALGELGVREALTLAVLDPAAPAAASAAAAAFTVWAMNLALPAALGALLFTRRP
jgi:hypothetical protein